MEQLFIDEHYTERLLRANETLLEAYDSLNFSDPDWDQKVERLSKLHKEITADIANVNNAILEAEKLRIEEEKNKSDAENEMDRLALDEAKDEAERENNVIRNTLDALKIAATVGVAAISGAVGIWKFKESTKREEEGAYLTTTESTTVKAELRREPKGGLFKLF